MKVDRQQADDRAGGRRHADEEGLAPRRLIFVDHDVEAGEAQRAGHREQERRDPAEVLGRVQVGDVEHERRRDAEVDEVGERIELGAEARGSLQRPRDPSVETVEHGGARDRAHRPFDRPLHRQADRGQAKAEREQGDDVGDQEPERHRPEASAARRADALAIGARGRGPASFTPQLR